MPDSGAPETTLSERAAAAREILAARGSIAATVTDEFLWRHPDWLTRYGELARKRGIEDAGFHVDFLAGAIESGSTAAFCDYVRWCSRVLSHRNIAPHFLAENLSQVGEALAAHGAARMRIAGPYLRAAIACLETAETTAAPDTAPLHATRAVFLQAILSGRRKQAVTIAREALREGVPVVDLYTGLFQAALYEIGEGWQTGGLTVAQEHMATATVQYVLAQIYADLPLSDQTRGNAIVTGVEGELHQVGANIVADILESDGWNVRFLGTNMPHRGILAALEEHEATLLAISATMLFNLPRVRSLVEEVRGQIGSDAPRIVVGGGAFRSSASFCAELGVDGPGRNVEDALRLGAA